MEFHNVTVGHPITGFRNTFPMTTVGKRIVQARKARGLSRPELADAAKIKYPTLAGLENGDQQTSSFLPQIASALGVNALWLSTGRGPIYPRDATSQPDYQQLSKAITVLQTCLEIMGKRPAGVSDPDLIAEAHGLVLQHKGDATMTVLELAKLLATRIRAKQKRAHQQSRRARTVPT